jgi:hypothetical protein
MSALPPKALECSSYGAVSSPIIKIIGSYRFQIITEAINGPQKRHRKKLVAQDLKEGQENPEA